MNTGAAPGAGVARGVGAAVVAILIAAYPFLLAAGLDHASARTIGALLLVAAIAAALLGGGGASRMVTLLLKRFGVLVLLAAAATATDHPAALTLLPSVTSLWLLATFGASLRKEPSIVGQFATAMHDGFPDFLLPYCRKVTWMWCVFFAVNAVVGIVLAVGAPTDVWAFYTGFVAYVLVAVLAAAEYVFHKSRFRFYEEGWADGIWRRICPPERTALGRRTLEWQLARARGSASEPPRAPR